MRKLGTGILLALLGFTGGTLAAQQTNNLIPLSNWDNPNLPVVSNLVYNEVFGWHDGNGREYAIIGSMGWTHFIDVTNPANPLVRDSVQGTHNQCIHRDFKTYGHYCYGVADEGNSTLQIIDLQYLPDSVHVVYNSPQYFTRCHNIFIDTTSGLLYTAGANTQMNGTIVLNLAANPENPPLVASVNLGSYTHDMFVRNDTAYMNNGFDGLRIVDFSTPTTPVTLAQLTAYPQQGYNHSSWLTEDGEYLVMCDETRNKSSKIIDVRNLGNVGVASMFRSALLYPDSTSIPHNPLVTGNYAVVAHYHDGVQMWDISNRYQPTWVAGYDTWPNNTTYNDWYGAWGTYPFLPSGIILGSDVHNGLFVFRAPFPFPYPLTNSVSSIAATCYNTADGSATAIPNGGTSPYHYVWSSGDTNATATYLLPGTYTVTVSDLWGFTMVDTVVVGSPPPLQVNAQVAAESCEGTADGEIDLNVSGGTPGYSYLWSTGDLIEDLNSLTAGSYTVTITDSVGCVSVDTVNVSFLLPAPVANGGEDTVLCAANLLLAAQSPSQGQGHWELISGSGNFTNPNLAITMLNGLQQGLNQVGWVVVNGQCAGVDTLDITVSSTAFIDAGPDTYTCTSNLQLGASSAGTGVGTWSSVPGTVSFSSSTNPTAIAGGLQPGAYTLFWSISDGNCSAVDSLHVLVSRPPFAVFSYGVTGLTASFTDLSQYATSWYWTFGDGGISTAQHPVHVYAQQGVYQVCLVATDTCGSDTTCQSVGIVGMEEGLVADVSVWPNPFAGVLNVKVGDGFEGPVECKLVDLRGRELWTGKLEAGSGSYRLDLPQLAEGTYFLNLNAADWTRVIRVMCGN